MSKSDRTRRGRKGWLAKAVAGILVGVLGQRLYRYMSRLLDQPVYLEPENHVNPARVDLATQALAIAERDLRAGLEKRSLDDGTTRTILCAGARNFREPWARDTGFALFGLLELGEYQAAKEALEIFLLTQHPSGQFPVKIHSTNILDRFMHSLFRREQPIDQPIRPKYITAHNTISLDGNCLIVIAVVHYAVQTGDVDFARTYWPALKAAMNWLSLHQEDGEKLLKQGAFSDWADTISRTGKVLYTNVLYWKALIAMEHAAELFSYAEDAEFFRQEADALANEIQTEFWREDLGYFVTSRYFDNLSSSGNLLAIAWDLTTPEQAKRILDAMRFFGMAIPVPTKAVHRAYPRQFIAIENRLGGIADYHTYFAWLWLGAWHIIALCKTGRLEEARELLYNMSRVIVRDGAVHEVYAPNGNYASSLWYTSESPLTWSAGMFIYAVREFQRSCKQIGD